MNIKNVLWISNGMEDLLAELVNLGVNIFVPKGYQNIPLNFQFQKIENLNEALELPPKFDMIVVKISNPSDIRDEKILLDSIETMKSNLIKFGVKNYREIVPIVDEEGLRRAIDHMKECGDVPLQDRRKLSLKALLSLIKYYTKIHSMLSEVYASEKFEHLILEKIDELNYGENPHQEAEVYKLADRYSILENIDPSIRISLSSNNLLNIYEALKVLKYLPNGSAILCSHGSVRSVAASSDPLKNVKWVVKMCTEHSVRGTIVFKGVIDEKMSKIILSDSNCYMLVAKKIEVKVPNSIKIVEISDMDNCEEERNIYRSIWNGFVKIGSDCEKAEGKLSDLDEDEKIAVMLSKFLKTVSVAAVKDRITLAVLNGMESSKDALKHIVFELKNMEKENLCEIVIAVDEVIRDESILPLLSSIGIKTLIEPGGSKEDDKLLKVADELGIKLLFTGVRHFRHI